MIPFAQEASVAVVLALSMFFLSRQLRILNASGVFIPKYIGPAVGLFIAACVLFFGLPLESIWTLPMLLLVFLSAVIGVAAHFAYPLQPKYKWTDQHTWAELMADELQVSQTIKQKLAQAWQVAIEQSQAVPTITYKEYRELVTALGSHMFQAGDWTMRVVRSDLGSLQIFRTTA